MLLITWHCCVFLHFGSNYKVNNFTVVTQEHVCAAGKRWKTRDHTCQTSHSPQMVLIRNPKEPLGLGNRGYCIPCRVLLTFHSFSNVANRREPRAMNKEQKKQGNTVQMMSGGPDGSEPDPRVCAQVARLAPSPPPPGAAARLRCLPSRSHAAMRLSWMTCVNSSRSHTFPHTHTGVTHACICHQGASCCRPPLLILTQTSTYTPEEQKPVWGRKDVYVTQAFFS